MHSCSMLLVVASSALAGCTILHSSSEPTDGGIAYHLPRSVIVAKVHLWKIPKEKTGAAKDKYVATIDNQKGSNGQPDPTRSETIPDVRERFVLTYNSNPFFYDRYCVLTTPNGLLSSVEYATEDKTPNVVLALSELGRKLGTGFTRGQVAGAEDDPVASVTVTFNPFDPVDRDAAAQVVNNSFRTRDINIDVRFDFPQLRQFGRDQGSSKCHGDKGLCFRTKIRTPMQLWDKEAKAWTSSVLVDVVNPDYVGHFDLDRAFMVEKVVRLQFQEGALNQVIMRKPSEALQTVKLPLAVVDAILAVPANFISDATGNTQTINNKLKAQRDEIKLIEDQLKTGVTEAGNSIYKPKCKGRDHLFNP